MRLSVGEEYQFREGGYVARVILEDFRFKKQFFFVYLRFIDEGQRLSQCCERFTSTAGFSGMWTLNNKGRYNLEKFRKRRERLLAEEQPGDLEVIWL